jgi:hypothetical protein
VAARRLTLVAALALLNASLAFHNIWPTPAFGWTHELSIELALGILCLIGCFPAWGAPSPRLVSALAAVWVVLVLGHYADVTAPALYGRDINLYWDVRYMPDVAAMIAHAAPAWLLLVAAALALAALGAAFLVLRWALRRVVGALEDRAARAGMGVAAGCVIVFYVALLATSGPFAYHTVFPTPVSATIARQLRLVAGAMRASTTLPPTPPLDADLARVGGADVFLIFVESYGAIAFEKPDVAPYLSDARGDFASALRATGRSAASAFVDSPTFGGSSWRAHVSLMSGVEVRDPETNARLLTEHRDTMVAAFRRHGFRAIALMPGLRQRWPEGAFYGFDQIDGAARLDYHGPEFGWFAIPDQFSLARLDALEVDRAPRPDLFVFYPTISTHFPFQPTPPYQPDWRRMFDAHPFDADQIVAAYDRQPDWRHFAPGYVDAVAYTYRTLAGYMRKHIGRDSVFVVLGDHQPAAAVSGENASWSVPVHVVASRRSVIDALLARGFHEGLIPARPALGRMHTLLPILLDAFSDRQSSAPSSMAAPTRGVALSY